MKFEIITDFPRQKNTLIVDWPMVEDPMFVIANVSELIRSTIVRFLYEYCIRSYGSSVFLGIPDLG